MNTVINERLVQHVSDLAAMFIKLHDYHWHVKGSQFKQLHELTEEYYDAVNEQLDAVAERLIQLGGTAPASLQTYAAKAVIKSDESGTYKADAVLDGVQKDFEYLLKEFKTTQKAASETGDVATDSLFADYIADLEKKLWMIRVSKE